MNKKKIEITFEDNTELTYDMKVISPKIAMYDKIAFNIICDEKGENKIISLKIDGKEAPRIKKEVEKNIKAIKFAYGL